MPIRLLLHTLATSTPVTGDCIVFWQNAPKLVPTASPTSPSSTPSPPPKLIDATPLTIEQIWPMAIQYQKITLIGVDLLLPLKLATPHHIVSFIRSLSHDRQVTVILNSDDALRGKNDHDLLLRTLAHAADRVTALRELPSGRDKEFAGMVRFSRGVSCRSSPDFSEGERLYKYRENMMDATLHT
ncbi:protein of unknown function [Taphrina deformans PYCC 5710]|uniref:Uncharacterized protein n=1 Tax=Taphrina deformans (strain PYCC 5710 / ATCC 11124 / CBS 356.35 / IMI 108563 / JCM 9778 / NBRC 8474) TaxID=1097556 RepID=R4X8X0_TAPDE|nr:protein of unknown function [Taphrina deformans PYCC 5710]|eukprot:CCG82104.1 protein of unknown function [Taphrina deformans PYCC 5710]